MSSIKEKDPQRGFPPAVDYEQGQTQLGTVHDVHNLTILGYTPELKRNRSMLTLLFQSLAIAAVSPAHLYSQANHSSDIL